MLGPSKESRETVMREVKFKAVLTLSVVCKEFVLCEQLGSIQVFQLFTWGF